MITSIDTNVLIAFWNDDDALNVEANSALEKAFTAGKLIICGAVYGELLSYPGRTEEFLDNVLRESEISVDWSSGDSVWRTAGSAFQGHLKRMRRQKAEIPRRILTDFFIGAQAFENNYRLLTLDKRIFRTAFPNLTVI